MADSQNAENPTDEQAMAAVAALMGPPKGPAGNDSPDVRIPEPQLAVTAGGNTSEPVTPTEPVQAEQVEAETPVAGPNDGQAESAPLSDDVSSLKAELDKARQDAESIRAKFDKTAAWSRDLALRKSNDVAIRDQLLRRMSNGEQVTKEEVDRLLAGQASQGGQPYQPQPFYQPSPTTNPFAPQPSLAAPDPALTEVEVSRFMVENRMSDEDAAKMVSWMQNPSSGLTPDDMVPGNTYQTLRLVHQRYTASLAAEKSAKAGSIASAARTQRAVAKAAGALTGAARATPASPAPPDLAKMALENPDKFVEVGGFDRALQDLMSGR